MDNKLASLEASLGRNYDPPTHWRGWSVELLALLKRACLSLLLRILVLVGKTKYIHIIIFQIQLFMNDLKNFTTFCLAQVMLMLNCSWMERSAQVGVVDLQDSNIDTHELIFISIFISIFLMNMNIWYCDAHGWKGQWRLVLLIFKYLFLCINIFPKYRC